MESHKHYSQSETEFLLSCAETDENEVLDYKEFVDRFHEPAKVRTGGAGNNAEPSRTGFFFFVFRTSALTWRFF